MAGRGQARSIAGRVSSWLVLVVGLAPILLLPLVTVMESPAWPREAEQLCGLAREQARAAIANGSWDGRGMLNLAPEELEGHHSYLYPLALAIGGADSTRVRVYAVSKADGGDAGFLYMDFDLQSKDSSIERVWPDQKLLRD